MVRFLGFLFTAMFIVFVAVAVAIGVLIRDQSKELPSIEQLATYEPPVMTRVHAGDGKLLAEYAEERRLYVPSAALPEMLVQAFLSAEDKSFFEHNGLDWVGMAKAVFRYAEGKATGKNTRLAGASTITQQVAKNFFLNNKRTIERKLQEALLARRIEQTFEKDKILELYLNEIYLGSGSYGVAAASLNYFGKSLNELEVHEMAYLAALPKQPSRLDPIKHTERATERRDWVLSRMEVNDFITEEQMKQAQAEPLEVIGRKRGVQLFASQIGAEAFTEEVRRSVEAAYGAKRLKEGGLSVRTTLDPNLQVLARQAFQTGLIKFDRKRGFRGPVKRIEVADGAWAERLFKIKELNDLKPWRLAVVLDVSEDAARLGLHPDRRKDGKMDTDNKTVSIPLANLEWARKQVGRKKDDRISLGPKVKSAADVLVPGDVVYVAGKGDDANWHLMQVPDAEGGLVALNPHTGRVLALVGGFSYAKSQYNRAVQAKRQPGSSFKPFVYATALDNGYTPASVVMDAPISIRQQSGEIWKPKNYSGKYYGPSTLRRGIELSRNVMTVRLAQDMGMDKIKDYAARFGIYDDLLPVLSMSLGAGETTLLKMTAAFAMLVNGGKEINPTLIDRIQDRWGQTVYRHDKRECTSCNATAWQEQEEPELEDVRKPVINPYTAYQMTSMLEGVVQRGTAKRAFEGQYRPLAGKTGTTNDERDAWFVGFAPDLAVGVYIGYDNPKPMGRGSTGGALAAPIFSDFMKAALKDEPATPFRVPSGVELIPINPKNGKRAVYGGKQVILEAFKPGEEPSGGAVIGQNADGGGFVPAGGYSAQAESSERDGGLTTGTGGLY
ncbi:MAG: penicillin-binding protein 1A [Hyphomicrobiales bacterium]